MVHPALYFSSKWRRGTWAQPFCLTLFPHSPQPSTAVVWMMRNKMRLFLLVWKNRATQFQGRPSLTALTKSLLRNLYLIRRQWQRLTSILSSHNQDNWEYKGEIPKDPPFCHQAARGIVARSGRRRGGGGRHGVAGSYFFFLKTQSPFKKKKAQKQLLSEITAWIQGMDRQSQVIFLQAGEKELRFSDCLPRLISSHLSSLTILYDTSPTLNKLWDL